LNQRRYAVASALAASAVTSLVMARGHRITKVPEIPLVVDNKTSDAVDKTKKAVSLLRSIGAFRDVQKAKDSRQIRAGKGKMRNRRYVQRRGPLIIYKNTTPLVKAVRNLPGVETCNVTRLNLLQLAPGGHLGRFIVWTKDAFESLDNVFGTYHRGSNQKKGFNLPRPQMTNPDFLRIVSSEEVKSHLRRRKAPRRVTQRKNPLVNQGAMFKLNPFARTLKRKQILASQARAAKKTQSKGKKVVPTDAQKKKRAALKKSQKSRRAQSKKNAKALLA